MRGLTARRSKSVSHAIWYPTLARAHVTVSRGIHFSTMGHSVARPTENVEGTKKIQKRLELLPEEALYLVERGAMYCWKPTVLPLHHTPHLDDMEGVPMTVQEAFAEMIGSADLTFEKYQVRWEEASLPRETVLDECATGLCVPQTVRICSYTGETALSRLSDPTSVPEQSESVGFSV